MQPIIAAVQDNQTTVKGAFGLVLGFSVEPLLPWMSAIVFILTATSLIFDLRKKWRNRNK
jgi:hypothetical protein